MRSNYNKLGQYIQPINVRNTNLEVDLLLGVSIQKAFMPSIANTVGTDMSKYKIVRHLQFAYGPVTSRNGDKISVALLEDEEAAIISQAYTVFEIIDHEELDPEYLMMWFRRPEFDRYARFKSHGSAREIFDWEEMCETELPVPHIDKQRAIVAEYNTVVNRIKLNEQLNQKLEKTVQALYRHWFVDFEFPNAEGKPYKSSGGNMVYNAELDQEIPEGWECSQIENLARLEYGRMLDSSKFLEKGFPVFSGYGIRGYYSKFMYEEPQILVLCRGVSGTGEVRMSPPKAYITNLSIVVNVDVHTISKAYLYYHLRNQNLRSLDSGSAQSQITIGDLNAFKVMIPSLSIQENFQEHVNRVANYTSNLKKGNNQLDLLRNSLLSKLTVMEAKLQIPQA